MTVLHKCTVKVLALSTPTEHTGRTYPASLVKKAMDEVAPYAPVLGRFRSDMTAWQDGLEKISHIVKNLWIEDDSLYAEIAIIDTEYGKMLDLIMQGGLTDKFYFAPTFTGTVDGDNVVTSIDKIVGIDVYPK